MKSFIVSIFFQILAFDKTEITLDTFQQFKDKSNKSI